MGREGEGVGKVTREGKGAVNAERFKVKKEMRKGTGKWLR